MFSGWVRDKKRKCYPWKKFRNIKMRFLILIFCLLALFELNQVECGLFSKLTQNLNERLPQNKEYKSIFGTPIHVSEGVNLPCILTNLPKKLTTTISRLNTPDGRTNFNKAEHDRRMKNMQRKG